jgi:hypothetical protein
MTIRAKLAGIKGKPPTNRKAVRCNSTAEANAVKHRWAVEDAIRTLNARVLYLAEQLDKLHAKRKRTG